ncbi:hypothetical protein, partial [Pseudomonas sp. FW300-N1A1]|uniref:hypothetical protein n=1 Tax=Pseudomonas sp. FW300-N1A1 TaxID=2075555 RepID=UPI001C43802D
VGGGLAGLAPDHGNGICASLLALLVPFWRLKKGLAVRAKPPAALTAGTDMYTAQAVKAKPPTAVTAEMDMYSITQTTDKQKRPA